MINSYELARDDTQKAIAALSIARRKQSCELAWDWANTAARHAELIGVENAREMLGTNTFPELGILDAAILEKVESDILIVTRHQGLVDWLAERGYTGKVVDRATPQDALGKHVIGKLPLPVAAITSSYSCVYVPGVPEDKWGTELTFEELNDYGAYMRTYIIKEINVIKPY